MLQKYIILTLKKIIKNILTLGTLEVFIVQEGLILLLNCQRLIKKINILFMEEIKMNQVKLK